MREDALPAASQPTASRWSGFAGGGLGLRRGKTSPGVGMGRRAGWGSEGFTGTGPGPGRGAAGFSAGFFFGSSAGPSVATAT
ncbi:hypothetical protein STANM309S_01793 [Streptomyces tanashiensis]